jgi:hypothetical protein
MTALTWSVKVVPGQTSQAVPVLAALGSELHMVYLGEHDQRIRHAVFAGGDWTPKGPVDEQTSQAVPILAAAGTELHMVYLGEHDQRIRHAVFRGGDWDPQGPIKDKASQTVQTSQAVPVLAAIGGQLHLAYLGEHSQRIHHAIGTI